MLENGECLRGNRHSSLTIFGDYGSSRLIFRICLVSIAKSAGLRLRYVRQLYPGCDLVNSLHDSERTSEGNEPRTASLRKYGNISCCPTEGQKFDYGKADFAARVIFDRPNKGLYSPALDIRNRSENAS